MLNIEVWEEQNHGHTSYWHSVVVEHEITPHQAMDFQEELHHNHAIHIAFNLLKPGDDVYGYPAEHYQFAFTAKRDMTEWLHELADETFGVQAVQKP